LAGNDWPGDPDEGTHRPSQGRNHQGQGHTVDDVLTGYWEWFRKDGTKMRSGYFENGKQAGEWTTYDAKRKVVKVTKMKSQGLSELPDAQRMARRCVKTTATLKISAAEDINIPRAQLSWRWRAECRYEWRWILTASMPKP
jgi:hypothetical protein